MHQSPQKGSNFLCIQAHNTMRASNKLGSKIKHGGERPRSEIDSNNYLLPASLPTRNEIWGNPSSRTELMSEEFETIYRKNKNIFFFKNGGIG